ncbi:hypothetical protein Trydic_g14227 [Trypoxylus dichotomus]
MAPEKRKPPGSRGEKMLAILYNEERYVVHYRNLKQYLWEGLLLTRIHRAEDREYGKPHGGRTGQKGQEATLHGCDVYEALKTDCGGQVILDLISIYVQDWVEVCAQCGGEHRSGECRERKRDCPMCKRVGATPRVYSAMDFNCPQYQRRPGLGIKHEEYSHMCPEGNGSWSYTCQVYFERLRPTLPICGL